MKETPKKIDLLIDADITELVKHYNLKEIAKSYSSTTYVVEKQLSKQIIIKHNLVFSNVKEVVEMDINCDGAWMQSAERESLNQFKN